MKFKPGDIVGYQNRTNKGKFVNFERVELLRLRPDWDDGIAKGRAWLVSNDFNPRHIKLKCRLCFIAPEAYMRPLKIS